MDWKKEAREYLDKIDDEDCGNRAGAVACVVETMLDHWPEQPQPPAEPQEPACPGIGQLDRLKRGNQSLKDRNRELQREVDGLRKKNSSREFAQRNIAQQLRDTLGVPPGDSVLDHAGKLLTERDEWRDKAKGLKVRVGELEQKLEELDRLYQSLFERVVRAKKTMGVIGFEYLNHAASRVVAERDNIQAQLAAQMDENARLGRERNHFRDLLAAEIAREDKGKAIDTQK